MNIDAPLKTQIPELRSLWLEAFGDTEEFLDIFAKTAFSMDRCRCITLDEKVVAALYWFDCFYDGHMVAYVYAVATAKAYRGQGLSHKLMENTHTHLKTLGYEGVILVPGSESLFQFYTDMGYQICSYIREFHCTSSNVHCGNNGKQCVDNNLYCCNNDEHRVDNNLYCCNSDKHPVDKNKTGFIREIDKTEYALLRPQFLPAGAVIQENENLDFLETMAKFYIGDHFLLAASLHGNNLFAMELLGDSSCAPGIVKALGCEEGTFRTPGTKKPFAMYYPLGEKDAPAPGYFGFAFD